MAAVNDELECLEDNDECRGAVEYRVSLSPTGISYPRCAHHWSKRLDAEEQMNERVGSWRSDVPPPWFDPTAAGERWSEDDY